MKSSFRQEMRGFPYWQIFIVSIMRFSEPLAFTSLFPYVYFMIRDFHVAKDEASISGYAGVLSASFAFTQFLFSVYWGQVSDRIGRKNVLIIGLIGTSISMLVFGFAPNFYVALAARSAMGAVNGNIAVMRTLLGELVTERKHQAIAFSTLPLLWNFGSIIGPLIGGCKYFTRPKEYNSDGLADSYDKFLDKYPYALSNVVVAIFLGVSVVGGFLFLEETHPRVKRRKDVGLEIGDWILNRLGYETPVRPWNKKRSARRAQIEEPAPPSEEAPLIDVSDSEVTPYSAVDDDDVSINSSNTTEYVGPMTRRMSDAVVRRYSSKPDIKPNLTTTLSRMSGISIFTEDETEETNNTKEAFTPGVVKTISANFLLACHTIVYSEFFPVFLAGENKPDKLKFPFRIQGGFGYSSDTIGTIISTAGMCGVCVVVFVYPILDRSFKGINNYRFATSIFPIAYTILPFYIFTLHSYNAKIPEGLTKYLLYANAAIYQLASGIAFPQVMLLVHRAAPAKSRALVNATALSSNAFARFVAPVLWGILMSFFDKIGFGSFTWFVLAGIAVAALVQAFTMEEYDEDLKPTGGV